MLKIGVVGDTHLGYRQYGLDERHEDFGKAWLWACQTFVDERCDFVVHTGDLFNSRQPDPVAMSQAEAGFNILNDALIYSWIVPGNHEIFSRYPNWIDYLDDNRLVKVLDRDCGVRPGIIIDLHGFPFSGSSINAKLVEAFSGERSSRFIIAVAHAGVEGVLPHNDYACIHRNIIEQIRPNCDLLLLGHIHKPFEIGNWVFNPGSLETTNSKELEWEDRGILILTIGEDRVVQSKRIPSPRREFVKDIATGPEHMIYPDSQGSIILIDLVNDPTDEIYVKDISSLEQAVKEVNDALMVRITDKRSRNQAKVTRPENVSAEEIESQILKTVFADKSEMAAQIKLMITGGADPDEIVDYVLGELNDPSKDNS